MDSAGSVGTIRFETLEGFQCSMPPNLFTKASDLLHTCFVFLVDTREDAENEVLSTLQQGFSEMMWTYEKACKQFHGRKPGLRAALLSHAETAKGEAFSMAEFVGRRSMQPFLQRLASLQAKKPKVIELYEHFFVDLSSSDAVFECMQNLAMEMYELNKHPLPIFTSSLHSSSRPSRCCSVL